jgi:hypothetical protein
MCSSLLGLLALPAGAQDATAEFADLSYKAVKKWNIILPKETWTDISNGIPVVHSNGDSFRAYKDGMKLALNVDTNGDGKTDKVVKGAKGYLVLKGKDTDGNSLAYAARFVASGTAYKFSSSGYLQARLAGETIRLIDQNNNGRFDEIGVDAMVVGKGDSASFLSEVVNLKGQLFKLSIDGNRVGVTPFDGEVGTLNLRSEFKSYGKLESAVVQSDDGKCSFELSGYSSGLTVPTGGYKIVGGLVTKGPETVRVGTGKMSPVDVRLGHETKVAWGGPVMGEFQFDRIGEDVTVQPTALKFYGKAGEEYTDFLPQGASPKFLVYDETTQKLLKTGRFGGC